MKWLLASFLVLGGCSYESPQTRAINAYHKAITGVCEDSLKSQSQEWNASCRVRMSDLEAALREISR